MRAIPVMLLGSVLLVPPTAPVPPSEPDTSGALIVRRHDREDKAYLALGARVPQVALLGGGLADGTLIGERWILTAAHVADGMMRRNRRAVMIDGQEFTASDIYIHPAFRPMGPHDIALLRLDRPVTHVVPLALYAGNDEQANVATLVGHGATGVGSDAVRTEDRRRRGATNLIETADSLYLVFRFDAPPAGTDLEGIPGPGDSGGPALLEIADRFVVAGVSSAGRPGPNGPGTYGATDYFTRVATHRDWLARVMAGDVAPATAPDNRAADVVRMVAPGTGDTTMPDTPVGRSMGLLLAFLASHPDGPAVVEFLRRHTTAGELEGAEFERRVTVWQRIVTEFEGIALLRIGRQSDDGMDVIVQTASGRRILGIRMAPGTTARIGDVLTGRPN